MQITCDTMGKGKLWHLADQKLLNRSSPNLIYVITSWVPINKKIWTRSVQGFLLPTYAKYTPYVPILLSFFVLVLVLPQEAQLPQRKSASAAHMKGARPSSPLPLLSLWLHLCVWSNPKPATNVRQACCP